MRSAGMAWAYRQHSLYVGLLLKDKSFFNYCIQEPGGMDSGRSDPTFGLPGASPRKKLYPNWMTMTI